MRGPEAKCTPAPVGPRVGVGRVAVRERERGRGRRRRVGESTGAAGVGRVQTGDESWECAGGSSVLHGGSRSPGPLNLSVYCLRLQITVATGRFVDGRHFSWATLFSYQRKEWVKNLLRTHVLTGHLGLRTCTLQRSQELGVFFLSKRYF